MTSTPYSLTLDDLPGLNDIQTHCYTAAMVESNTVMAGRLAIAADWSWGIRDDVGLCAYLLCYPCRQGHLGHLNAEFRPAQNGNTLYLHDLAIHPRARGRKLAQALVRHAQEQGRAAGLTHSALISVQNSQAFWAQLGYQVQSALDPAQSACLAAYPPPAHYMTRMLSA